MKKFLLLFMYGLLAVTLVSCMAPTDVVYVQDLTPTEPKVIPPVHYVHVKPEDKLYINIHCRDENIASLFNVRGHGYYGGGGYGRYGGASTDLHTYNVDENGDIDFPVVGKIHVEGLTRQEVANHVRDVLVQENLVRDPYVSCSFATAYYYCMGEIGSRGQVQIPKDAFTIIEAIAQAGDIQLQGVRTNVQVIREEDGYLRTYEVDMTNAEAIVNSPVYYIQPGDVIYVQPSLKRQYETTTLGNTVRTPSFWLGLTSSVISLGLTIYAVTTKFK